jgi:hypothetical protein
VYSTSCALCDVHVELVAIVQIVGVIMKRAGTSGVDACEVTEGRNRARESEKRERERERGYEQG